ESSTISHNAEYIQNLILLIISQLGSHRVVTIVSDNGPNVRGGQELIADCFPHILNIQDPVHHLHNTCKDIANLPILAKTIIRFFSHSWHASTQLRLIMDEFSIKLGFQKVGNTRFATLYYGCSSVLRLLECIAALVQRELADASNVSVPLFS
ncbi:hypothetical protein BDV93DRAFT_458636, partial [Ceratobasidium sp. AG-I]